MENTIFAHDIMRARAYSELCFPKMGKSKMPGVKHLTQNSSNSADVLEEKFAKMPRVRM